jgi:preprotein translocase subunit SecG
MYIAIIILVALISILLILVILMQDPKSGGISSQFGGAANQMIGAKKSTDILEKITWSFAAVILAFSLLSNVFTDRVGSNGLPNSVNQERASEKRTAPVPNTQNPNTEQVPLGSDSTK